MNRQSLRQENRKFANTSGISSQNRSQGFVPAFRDEDTGQVELARFEDGRLAPMHVISGLPESWAEEHDGNGAILTVKASIIAGFCKDGRFYTRDEAISECQAKGSS